VKEVRDAVAGELGTNVSGLVSAAMNQALAKR
jgi:post-segregation antitoxin (ccd killing protein)